MVSVLPILFDTDSQDFFGCMEMDPLHSNSTKVPSLPDDPSKKIRKPYTITKSRESWSEQEHDKFLEALQLFDRDWKKIEAFVGSKTAIQIRSHAQKYFLKVQKNGTSEHVPPPRPKRKAAHPYPQKASKSAVVVSQSMAPTQPAVPLIEPGYMVRPDSLSVNGNPPATTTFPSWTYIPVPSADSVGLPGAATIAHNCSSSSNESASKNKSMHAKKPQWNLENATKVMPDFAEVYNFIGSVFAPNESGHLQKLKEMDPINVETAAMLMQNLAINLVSPEFEEQRKLLSSYDVKSGKIKAFNNFPTDLQQNAIPSM